jgi:hypothetical protein
MVAENIRLAVQGFWWVRDESLDDACCRINQTFHQLAGLAPEWAKWRRSYQSIEDREHGPMILMERPDLIRQELIAGQITGPGGQTKDYLGYFLSASAGPAQGKGTDTSHLMLRCCSRGPYPSGYNELTVELPVPSATPALYDARFLGAVIKELGRIWDPDWITVWDRLTNMVPPPWAGGPMLGWINYLPTRTGEVVGGLPAAWQWFDESGGRQIFLHTDGPPEARDPRHRRAFGQIARKIRWGASPLVAGRA